jgi:subtilisin family serine protease
MEIYYLIMKKLIIPISLLFASLYIGNNVQAISYNTQDVKPATTRVKFNFALDKTNARIGTSVPFDNNYQGQDTYIVVIDTGIETAHPFFQGRVALEACFAASCPNGSTSMIGPGAAKPVHWHGTHVAGIVAGYNTSFNGVAPKAKIIAVNVFDPSGGAYDDNIIKALKWVDSIASSYNIAAVNMSLGTSQVFTTSCNSYLPEMTSAIVALKSKNIATVVAAGNNYSYGMSSPACISDTVSVAATYSEADEVTNFSNVSEKTTLSAPGYVVKSSVLMSSYNTASGTSMASPTVAGAFAVYRSKFGIKSVDTVVSDYKTTGVSALDKATKIVTKRIDLRTLFADTPVTTTTTSTTTSSTTSTTSTTTTIPSTSTSTTSTTAPSTTIPSTTIPSTTTTTTTISPPDDPDEDEDVLNVPTIFNLRKFHSTFLSLSLGYKHNNLQVTSFRLHCLYNNGSSITRSLRNNDLELTRYLIRISTANLSKCKIAAVSSSATGLYSRYSKVK